MMRSHKHAKRDDALNVQSSQEDLFKEVQRLRRKLYLMEVRKDAMNLGSFMGDDEYWKDDWVQRWKAAYPHGLKAKYCMAGTKGEVLGNCQDMQFKTREAWRPPAKPLASLLDKEDLDVEVVKIGPPFSPSQMPRGLFEVMTMTSQHVPYWDMLTLRKMYDILDTKADVGPIDYPNSHIDVQGAIDRIGGLVGKRVLVVGSISPWMESIALHNNASRVTTVDYNAPILAEDVRRGEPRLSVREMRELLDSGDQFDVVLSYSSIEHDGLGRYNDPLNPDGDLAAMKEMYQFLAPHGKLLLGIPASDLDGLYYIGKRMGPYVR